MEIDHTESTDLRRWRLHVNGIVQGVGFRPFVFNLARRLELNGFISNNSAGVIIEIEGAQTQLDQFLQSLRSETPPLAEITEIHSQAIPIQNQRAFVIEASESPQDNQTLISPDVCVCDDCRRELFDPADRRYMYPFINCTNCGPRFTIIRRIPYDRPFTAMAEFKMCPACQAEYDDPANRRFHAQPNACAHCGPQVWYESLHEACPLAKGPDAFDRVVRDLVAGKSVAIKGLGGFHLAVDATNEAAVKRLRSRKNREEKPLAIMLPDLEKAKSICQIDEAEAQFLCSAQRPIVLLQKLPGIPITETVAPANKRLGLMLPYTPLHFILFERLQKLSANNHFPALVMTSANLSEEPIAVANDEARRRLAPIADSFLMHNRDILVRADDSVLAVFDSKPTFFRRSRSYVPRPIFMKDNGPVILALGGELKNTICLLKNNRAFLSQHIGDLENLAANDFFTDSIEHFQKILDVRPQALVCDRHPAYFSTQWAEQQFNNIPLFKIQHHHAHHAAAMAEHHLSEPTIGIILDGSGYGLDKTIWGGEILIADFVSMKRYAYFEPLPLSGGELAIRQPWRTAVSYLYATFEKNLPQLPFMNGHPVTTILELIDKKINCPMTSSCGRLFDAVSAMSGGRQFIKYEAQAAIEMMQAVESINVPSFELEITIPQIHIKPIIRAVAAEAQKGTAFPVIAARFHKTLIELLTQVAMYVSRSSGIKNVVLSGGVFQNEILLNGLSVSLNKTGLKVFTHKQVPPNDGGISLGQAVIGQQLLLQGKSSVNYL